MIGVLLTLAMYLSVITATYAAVLFGLDRLLMNRSAIWRAVSDSALLVFVVLRFAVTVTPVVARMAHRYVVARRQIRMGGAR